MRASSARKARLFAVPPLPPRVVARPRLLERLDSVLVARHTTLSGPAGAGKTTAAAQWCNERCPVPVAWATLEDDDAGFLAERVLDALQSIDTKQSAPDGASNSDVDGDAHGDEDVIERLRVAASDASDCVIVVDLGRTAAPAAAVTAVVRALTSAPTSGVHVLHLSRTPFPAALAPMLLQGAAARIDPSDLVLEPDEVAAVVQAHSGRALETGTAVELTTWLGGWMAGAALVGMAGSARESNTDAMIAAAWPSISSYIAGEIIEPLPEPLGAFLRESACVGELCAPLCDVLSGRTDSQQLLQSVRESGLPFVHGTSGFESLRLLGLLRAALDEKATNDDPDGRARRLRRAIEWYSDNDIPIEAAECSFRIGDWNGVVETAVTHLRSILDRQQFGRVLALAARAPTQVLANDANGVVTLAALLLWDGRIAAMYDLLGAFQQAFEPRFRALADLLRAGASSWVDDPAAALAAAESALAAFRAPDPDREIGDHEVMGAIAMAELAKASALLAGAYAGQWERARPHLVELPEGLQTMLPQLHHLRVRGTRATFLALGGEADLAVREGRAAELIAADLGQASHRMAADAYWALGEASRLRADFADVDAFVTQVDELSARNGRRNLAAAAVATRAHMLVDTGRAGEAVELIATDRRRDYGLPLTIAAMLAAAEARAVCATGAPTALSRCCAPPREHR